VYCIAVCRVSEMYHRAVKAPKTRKSCRTDVLVAGIADNRNRTEQEPLYKSIEFNQSSLLGGHAQSFHQLI
jgi:hypothetical protein